MRNIVKLYEVGFPGILIGKRVVTKETETIGICSGIILDIDNKEVAILVSARDLLLRIKLDDILMINDKEILVEKDKLLSIKTDKIDDEIEALREEIELVGKLMCIETNLSDKKRNKLIKNINIARLFHLI